MTQYNLEAFVRYLGNPLDGTEQHNVMLFNNGRQRYVKISTVAHIEKAEAFIAHNDGKHQLYINVNPYKVGIIGKGRDNDVLATKNLYVDADRIKTPDSKHNPATDEEMMDIPIGDITCAIREKYPTAYLDFTGNGFRFIVPVEKASPKDEVDLICYMYNLFPDYIDRSVRDPSRITGVPATMNVKIESEDRPNRRRAEFDLSIKRSPVAPATYTDEEIPPTMRPADNDKTYEKRTYEKLTPDVEIQPILNKYILDLQKNAPHILLLLATPPIDDLGFEVDGLFAAEVLNKIGDAPRVYATIMKKIWGSQYRAEDTKKMWYNTVEKGMGAWSLKTFRRVFGNYEV